MTTLRWYQTTPARMLAIGMGLAQIVGFLFVTIALLAPRFDAKLAVDGLFILVCCLLWRQEDRR